MVSVDTVRRLIRLGELDHKVHWHTYYVLKKDVEKFAEKHQKLLTGAGADQTVRTPFR